MATCVAKLTRRVGLARGTDSREVDLDVVREEEADNEKLDSEEIEDEVSAEEEDEEVDVEGCRASCFQMQGFNGIGAPVEGFKAEAFDTGAFGLGTADIEGCDA